MASNSLQLPVATQFATQRVVKRAEKILDRLESVAGLTKEGRDWLIMATDPFHDNPLTPTGYPDSVIENSVVQSVQLTKTISMPSTNTDSTWNCNITLHPSFYIKAGSDTPGFLGECQELTTSVQGYPYLKSVTATSSTGFADGMCVASYSSSHSIFSGASTTDWTTTVNVDPTYFSGSYRVVSGGFEVYNTTADIYKQGLCTVYRSPVPTTLSSAVENYQGIGATTWSQPSVLEIPEFPKSPQEATLYPGTSSWDAKEGCYVTAVMKDINNPIFNQSLIQPKYTVVSEAGVKRYFLPSTDTFTVTNSVPLVFGPRAWTNFHHCGAIFTGLSPQTTLAITLKLFIEHFPDFTESSIVTLARPSPRYDPLALELYSHIMSSMPSGVMVKENGLGEWFTDAIGKVASVAAPILRAIPHPVAQTASKVLSGVNSVVQSSTQKKKKTTKKKS